MRLGAKFYYLRNILHDYPEKPAVEILTKTAAAMDDDSLILIDEKCLPEKGVPLDASSLDLLMGFSLGALERTGEQWHDLLDKAGLKAKHIYQYTRSLNDSVIVAVPKSRA